MKKLEAAPLFQVALLLGGCGGIPPKEASRSLTRRVTVMRTSQFLVVFIAKNVVDNLAALLLEPPPLL